jgi:alpha-L-arabinofuranosidase
MRFLPKCRWYDIRIEVKGPSIKCYLDGKLIHDIRRASLSSLYASATRDSKSGEIILKVVNASAEKIDTGVHLKGANKLARSGEVIVLTSENPADENSLDAPGKVSPKTETLNLNGPDFQHVFPGNSLTVLRIGADNGSP